MSRVARRAAALFLVLLALFQSVPVAVDAWQAGQWPATPLAWLRLAVLPVALWLYLRYFSVLRRGRCGEDDDV